MVRYKSRQYGTERHNATTQLAQDRYFLQKKENREGFPAHPAAARDISMIRDTTGYTQDYHKPAAALRISNPGGEHEKRRGPHGGLE